MSFDKNCLLIFKINLKLRDAIILFTVIFYTFVITAEPEPYIDGVRINSPHYLCKIVVPQGGTTRYTLVMSQYEKSSTIFYTLRAYSTCPFTLSNIKNVFKHKQEVSFSVMNS